MTAANTSKPLNTTAPKSGQLHRLGFVPQYSSLASRYANAFYTTAKQYVPESLKPQLNNLEQFYGKHGQPVFSKLADGGQEVLLVADSQLDGVINNGLSFYNNSSREIHNFAQREQISRQFASTRDTVVKRFQHLIEFAHKEGVTGSLRYVRGKAYSTVEDSFNFALKVLSLAQEKSQKVLGVAQQTGQQAHDSLVKQPLYKKAYDSSNNLLGAAQDTAVYKETVKRLYPVVAPIADPAFEKIQPYYRNTVEYWKPISAAA